MLGCAILREEMALEQEHRITFIEGGGLESEEVKITPPARRKKAEKMKNKAGRNSPLSASDEVSVDDGCSNNILPAGLPAEISPKQGETENFEPVVLNNDVASHGDAMNSEKCETIHNGVSSDKLSANDSIVSCDENSSVEPNDLAAYANETNTMQSSNENDEVKGDLNVVTDSNLVDPEFVVGRDNSRESCISPDISASASHDEESFFSAEEAETSQEMQSSNLYKVTEVVNETSTQLENIEDPSLVNKLSEPTNSKGEAGIVEAAICKETSQSQISDQSDQRSTFEALEEPSENTPDLPASANENLSTETSFTQSTAGDNVGDPVRVDSSDSLSEDADGGAIGGIIEPDSETDEEWSSSSYSSSEGEYDISFAEQFRGIKELDEDSDQDSFQSDFKDGVEEILSAFPANYFTPVVNVTDSEDDSNKGDSLNSTAKTTEDSLTENSPSPLNIMGDHDVVDAGKQILSSFPQSECPVIVDITSNDSGTCNKGGNIATVSAKDEDTSSDNERTSGNVAATVVVAVLAKESDIQSPEDVSATDTTNADHRSVENVSVTDQINADQTKTDSGMEFSDPEIEDRPVKRTGSFRLINNNGVLKVIDSGETPVTTENVKEARLLKNKSLKRMSTDSDNDQSKSTDSAEARKQLDNTVSEARALDKEFQNVCEDIATLEKSIVTEGTDRTVESENEENNPDVVDGEEDSCPVIISVDSMSSSAEQRPKIKVEGVTVNESTTDEQEDPVREDETNGSADETGSSSSNLKRQRPKRLVNAKRYSLGTESALLSPEDDSHVELTNFGSNNSIKSDVSGVSSTSDSQTDIAKVSTDGQQPEEEEVTPSPPPRVLSGRHKPLNYSGSFSQTATRPMPVIPKEGGRRLPKRTRSERSKTLPNNVFDAASDKFSRLFTSSSSSEPIHQGPITLITDNMPATFTGFPINRRAQVALELYTTERSYVRGLETILQLFKKPCEDNKLLEKKEIQTMFSNIQDIYLVNKDVLFMLLERVSHWSDQQCLGDIFADQSFKIIDRMKIYAKFCNNYDSAEALYKQKIKRKDFESFVNSCYEHTVCQPGLNLPAYLITVVQRIPRYILLLEDFFKRTPENHPDHANLSKALTKMGNLAVYINNQLQTTVGQKAMVELRSRVLGLKAFEVPGRALIKEADVVMSGSKKTRKCLLFNDLLVFAVKGVTKTSEVEQTLELVTLWCMDLEGNNPQSAKEDSFEIYTPEQSYILDAGTKTEKKAWLQKLRTRIAMALHGAEATERNEIESRKANFTYKDGRIFSGNFVSGKRHGDGTMSWPNQARYQGLWEDDERNGWGELMYNSGDKYRGEWLDDKQHGVGTMEYTSGDAYHGQWDMGDMHGQGRITFKNGDQFTGEFDHNEIEGIGELRCVSGLTYKGEWKHSKKHGKGKMHFPNGDVYSGQFANDRISGQGDMQYANGSVYKGQWVDNQRGGYGEFSSSDGTHYVGGWSGDHVTGKGRMTYSNGDCYDGNWFKNTRFGQGVMNYSNGDIYEGVFEYDLRSKLGKMTYKDGSVYEGSWDNGLRHGKGKMVYSDKKSKFEGEWMLGLRHGEGVLTFANGSSYTGHWEFDKQNGRGMYTDPSSGYRYEGEWQNGLKHGKGVEQTTEGTYEGEWKDNMRHGQGREILSCETEFEGRWKENRKHGAGTKKLKTGRMEDQVWREGKHVDVSSVVVTELPLIQRR